MCNIMGALFINTELVSEKRNGVFYTRVLPSSSPLFSASPHTQDTTMPASVTPCATVPSCQLQPIHTSHFQEVHCLQQIFVPFSHMYIHLKNHEFLGYVLKPQNYSSFMQSQHQTTFPLKSSIMFQFQVNSKDRIDEKILSWYYY